MGSIKLYALGFTGFVLLSALGSAAWYYSWSQDEIKTLTANNIALDKAVEDQKSAIVSLVEDAVAVGEQLILVNKEFQDARGENAILRAKLAKHDVAFLASKKPGLIKKIVNKGTDDVGRCFEILSGSPLTEKEINATKKSQSNSSCPDVANPNYEAKQ